MALDTMSKIDSFIANSGLSIQIDEYSSGRIPQDGPAVLLVNRIYGSAEPLVIFHLLKKIRIDFTIFSKQLEDLYPELEQISTIDFNQGKEAIKSKIDMELGKDRLVVLFPAKRREVTAPFGKKRQDTRWNKNLIEALYEIEVPVMPVFIANPPSQKAVGSRKSLLTTNFSIERSAKLISKLSERERNLHIKVGKPLQANHHNSFKSAAEYGRYLRARLFALDTSIEVNSFFKNRGKKSLGIAKSEIDEAVNPLIIETELNHLPAAALLVEKAEFSVYLASAGRIPNTIKEIGRLREITFRAVGEGTGFSADIDEFDLYYHQLILWDKVNKKIAGGYRIGFGGDIMSRYGKRGMYVSSLFKIKNGMNGTLQKSIELGRSYVVPEYQKARLPLFLLWKGILSVLLKHSDYQYLIGPVSISNDYSHFSRQLIVSFIKRFYWDENLAQFVRPRSAFKINAREADISSLMSGVSDETNTLEKVIAELEPVNTKVPILIKKYMKQNAKIIGFSLDRNFADALDGLMILDIRDIPQESIANLREDLSQM
jgi:putative hemolysin